MIEKFSLLGNFATHTTIQNATHTTIQNIHSSLLPKCHRQHGPFTSTSMSFGWNLSQTRKKKKLSILYILNSGMIYHSNIAAEILDTRHYCQVRLSGRTLLMKPGPCVFQTQTQCQCLHATGSEA